MRVFLVPEIWEWEGSTESYHEARRLGFPKDLVDANRMLASKGLPAGGNRKAIKDFTRVSRDRLKFTLRNALTGFPLAR